TGVGLKTAFKRIGDMFASLTGEQMYAVTSRINELKNELINRLKAKAVAQGANAIVGIDFESTMPGGSAIMVSANGTAVIIEKIEQ
ncbi:MAG: heavy metal-binding domain-containing protein, partial [Clostridia bacterium]|nr:heavy metal-binding domain-containing protein [Clostridia bacterium]